MDIEIIGKTSVELNNVIWFYVKGSDSDESLEWGINEDLSSESLLCDGSACDCIDADSQAQYGVVAFALAEKVKELGGIDKIAFV